MADLTPEEIARNIEALKQKKGDARTGGKGSQRRKVKVVHKNPVNDDKKIKTIVKKLGVQPLQTIDEVNFFKDDNTVMHFTKPDVLASMQSNTFVVIGTPETKTIKDLLPDIVQQLGPKQFSTLKDLMSSSVGQGAAESKEQEAPPLVPTSFEETAKVQ